MVPDLVLLDIHLPDISGFEVCRRIKMDPETASIMVMQITASAVELKDALAGLNGGADDFLLEPVEPDFLVAKVRSLLRLRMAEERLRRSNNDLARFAFVASHDLQEPLRAMVTFAQMLDRDYRSRLDEKAAEYLNFIITGGQRMSALIRDLLDYSRISSNSQEETQLIDMTRVVNETREWLRERLSDTNGTIQCGPLPVIRGPEVRVAQLVRNLIENAIKYRRAEAPLEIRVSAKPGRGEWIFTVSDNGQGFESAYNEEIFGVFRRLDRRDVQGTGMGLAICRAVVENAGGKIWAEGRPGEGATFYFSWPMMAGISAAAGSPCGNEFMKYENSEIH